MLRKGVAKRALFVCIKNSSGDLVQARWMENWDVPDPARGGTKEFRKVRDMLLERVRRLVAAA